MRAGEAYYPECPEAFLVSLARTGDRAAFEELVRQRQAGIRHLMRRLSGDPTLADDLAQQVLLKVWMKIHTLRTAGAFGGWLKRLAVSIWLQHVRKNDALRGAAELQNVEGPRAASAGFAMDLDSALAGLSNIVRLCVVLSYQEGMSHREIADATDLPLGTVKSHIHRGAAQLKESLAAYATGDSKTPLPKTSLETTS